MLKSDLRGIETKEEDQVKLVCTQLKSDLRGIETQINKTVKSANELLKSDLRGIETVSRTAASTNLLSVKIRP